MTSINSLNLSRKAIAALRKAGYTTIEEVHSALRNPDAMKRKIRRTEGSCDEDFVTQVRNAVTIARNANDQANSVSMSVGDNSTVLFASGRAIGQTQPVPGKPSHSSNRTPVIVAVIMASATICAAWIAANSGRNGQNATTKNKDGTERLLDTIPSIIPDNKKLATLISTANGSYSKDSDEYWIITLPEIDDDSLMRILEASKGHNILSLDLSSSTITDKSLTAIVKFGGIEYLYLQYARITDNGVNALSELPLQELQLHDTPIGNSALKNLPVTIRSLMLDNTNIDDSGVMQLRELDRLRMLFISGTGIGDVGLQLLGDTKLEWLDLTRTEVTDDGLQFLPSTIEKLELDATSISDDGLKEVAKLTRLKELKLSNTRVSDRGMDHLLALDGLRVIDLTDCQNVSDVAISRLKNRFGNELEIKKNE